MNEFGFLIKNVCNYLKKYKVLVVDQPNYNFGHFVVFAGGNSTYFDINTSQWTDLGEFESISNEENQAEVLFIFRAQIFLMLYVHFGDLIVKSLYKFNSESNKFELFGNIKVIIYFINL